MGTDQRSNGTTYSVGMERLVGWYFCPGEPSRVPFSPLIICLLRHFARPSLPRQPSLKAHFHGEGDAAIASSALSCDIVCHSGSFEERKGNAVTSIKGEEDTPVFGTSATGSSPSALTGRNPAPTVVGRYALYGILGSGGMAMVHFGRLLGPVGFTRTVAIKRLHSQYVHDPHFVAMFLDEARLATRIRHPNVVPTIDIVATDEEIFLVMEYVHGESLAQALRALKATGASMSPRIAVSILCGVLHGLHAAHEACNERGENLSIVHRDVSPQNIIIGADGLARVLDFGIAKASSRLQTTSDGQVKGKLAYMAPEQLTHSVVTRAVDIYSAGVVLWEALAGRKLYEGDLHGLLGERMRIDQVVESPRSETVDISPELEAVLLRSLSPRPEDRFATAKEMSFALERALAPASQSEVSEWLDSIAHETLTSRAKELQAIESGQEAPLLERDIDKVGELVRSVLHWDRENSAISGVESAAEPQNNRNHTAPKFWAFALGISMASLVTTLLVVGFALRPSNISAPGAGTAGRTASVQRSPSSSLSVGIPVPAPSAAPGSANLLTPMPSAPPIVAGSSARSRRLPVGKRQSTKADAADAKPRSAVDIIGGRE